MKGTMYTPALFREDRIEVLSELIRRYPLATLVTVGVSGIEANHAPLLYDPEPAPFGTLRGHLARANPQWRLDRPEFGALAVFQGPQAYVSPSFYPSKQEHGKVVPTWNYAVVHAHATVTIHEDAEWLRGFVTRLTEVQEAAFADPWQVSDAPPDYIEELLKGIVGIELHIHKLEGKWKASQNRALEDRLGVIENLDTNSIEMARIMRGGKD
jgi:transcriptional regulator